MRTNTPYGSATGFSLSRIISDVIAIGYEQQQYSLGSTTDCEEALATWEDQNQLCLTSDQECAVTAAFTREFAHQ